MAAIRTRSLPLPEAVPVVAAAAFSISVGVAVLIGWIFQLPTLRSVLPGLVPMQLNTAAAFIMLGVALAVIHARTATAWQLRLAQASALGVIFLAAWSLGQYVIVRTVGIGGGLIKETMPNPTGELGHMSPLTAVSFASLATATLLLRTTHYLQRWIVQCCVILPLLISTRALIGYVYRAHTLYFVGESMPLALHTTTTFIVLCLGLLGSRTDLELTALVRRRSAGGVAARRLLPAVLCAPLLLGMAILHGESIGLYGRDTSLTLFTISMCGLLMWLVWWAAHSIDDVDEQRQIAQRAERESRILSDFDPLTGLLNRRSFLTRCEQERLRAQREERPMSCIMLDIDYFKKINDTHGHSVGDMVLRTLAAIFCDECRSEDLVCRYGGEEF
ncbi:MAG: diguanylate cyclase, partial [Pirellulaceae bacterium]